MKKYTMRHFKFPTTNSFLNEVQQLQQCTNMSVEECERSVARQCYFNSFEEYSAFSAFVRYGKSFRELVEEYQKITTLATHLSMERDQNFNEVFMLLCNSITSMTYELYIRMFKAAARKVHQVHTTPTFYLNEAQLQKEAYLLSQQAPLSIEECEIVILREYGYKNKEQYEVRKQWVWRHLAGKTNKPHKTSKVNIK